MILMLVMFVYSILFLKLMDVAGTPERRLAVGLIFCVLPILVRVVLAAVYKQ